MRMVYILGCAALFTCFDVMATKKACQPYLDKLRNIQAKQRVGHSNKKGRSLVKQEAKFRDKWWQCQQGKLVTKNKKGKSKVKNKVVTNKTNTKELYKHYQPNMTNQLVLKAKYQGQQQQDWLDYYQQPNKCKRPKSTKVFAYCIEDEQQQQLKFERQYQQ